MGAAAGRLRTFAMLGGAFALFLVWADIARAQQRELQAHELESAEGRLLGFYSSALALTSLGTPFDRTVHPWALEGGLELSYVPYLTRRQRTAGFDKPEASNLSPVLPRPRLAVSLPGGVVLEGSWLPPLKVVDATANLFSAALRRGFALGEWKLTPRVSVLDGRVSGSITCNAELASGSVDDQVYFANVCHGNESDDYFDPSHLVFDVTVDAGRGLLGMNPYATAGLRRESTRFDIGVQFENGERDLDHPVLEMKATRPFGAIGLQWKSPGRTRFASEVFISPGSLVTLRAIAAWRIR